MAMKMIRSAAVSGALLMLLACAVTPSRLSGEVSMLSLEPEGAERHSLGSSFLAGLSGRTASFRCQPG